MANNILKIGLRRNLKQPLFSMIKYIGLAIGISCVLLIFLWIKNERNFDRFHDNPEQICRLIMNMGEYGHLALTPPPAVHKIQKDFAEVEFASRIEECPKLVVMYGDEKFYEEGGIFTDPDFMHVFSFQLLQGNRDNLLDEAFNIVISENLANK